MASLLERAFGSEISSFIYRCFVHNHHSDHNHRNRTNKSFKMPKKSRPLSLQTVELKVRMCCTGCERVVKNAIYKLKGSGIMADAMRKFVVRYSDTRGKMVCFPNPFIDCWGEHLGSEVILHHPDGKRFTIKLQRDDNSVWFGDGWSAFTQYNKIQFRDTIYFMYKWENVLDVVVFGWNGIEKMKRSAFQKKTPFHFYKMCERRSFATKLVLPDDFTGLCGKVLKNPMGLVFPDVGEFKVFWERNQNPDFITLVGGWQDFVNKVGVQRHDMLIFRFDWTDEFIVDVVRHDSGLSERFHIAEEMEVNKMVGNVFNIKVAKGSAQKGQPLYIPAAIAREVFKHKPPSIPVKLPSGENSMWMMIYAVDRKEVKIGGSAWYDFMEENELKGGDVLKFEMKGREGYYDVDVLRN